MDLVVGPDLSAESTATSQGPVAAGKIVRDVSVGVVPELDEDGNRTRRSGQRLMLRTVSWGMAVAGLVLIGVGVWTAPTSREDRVRREGVAGRVLFRSASELIEAADRSLEPMMAKTRRVASSARVRQAIVAADPRQIVRLCDDLVRGETPIDAVAIFDRDGQILGINHIYRDGRSVAGDAIERVMRADFSGREIIQGCLRPDATTGRFELQTDCDFTPALFGSRGLSVAYSVPVTDDGSGERLGVITVRLRFDRLADLVRRHPVAGGQGYAVLVSDDGRRLDEGHHVPQTPEHWDVEQVSALARALADAGKTHITMESDAGFRGFFRWDALNTVHRGGVQVMVYAPSRWIDDKTRSERWRHAAVPFVGGLLFIAIGFGVRLIDIMRQRRDESERLALIAKRTTNAVVVTDARRRITWVNEGFTRISGYTSDEVLGKSPGSLLQFNATNGETITAMRRALASGNAFRGMILNRGKHGREYWLDLDIQPYQDSRGRLIGFMAIQNDVTAQVMAERQLRSVFATVAEGIVLTDLKGKIVEWNPAAERILGRDESRLSGVTFGAPDWRSIDERQRELPAAEQPIDHCLRAGESVRASIQGIHRPDGELRWLSVSAEPVLDAQGRLVAAVASFADITEQIDQKLELQRQRAELDLFFNSSIDLLCIASTEGRFLRLNPEWSHTLGYPLDRLLDIPFLNLVHPEDLRATRAALQRLSNQRPVENFTNRYRCQDGSYRWIEWRSTPVGDRIYASARDITDQKESSEKVVRREREMQAIFSAVPGVIYRCQIDAQWTMDWISDGIEGLVGYPRQEFVGNCVRSFSSVIHPDDQGTVEDALHRAMKSDQRFEVRYRVHHRDGSLKWVHERGSIIRDPNNGARSLIGFIVDVTAGKRTEDALARSEAFLRGLFELSPLGIALNDAESGRFLDVNDAMLRITGYDQDELCKMRLRDVVSDPQGDDPLGSDPLGDNSQGDDPPRQGPQAGDDAPAGTDSPRIGRTESVEQHCLTKSGRRCPVRVSSMLIRDNTGKRLIWSIVEDVTDSKRAAQDLMEANRELAAATERATDLATKAEEANRSKSDFLANMSHEIRTPMTAILGYAELLAQDLQASAEERHDYIRTIQRNGEHLLTIINDILDLSKIESGKMTVERIPIRLLYLLKDVESLMAGRAAEKRIRLEFAIAPGLPARIVTDPVRLKQILINLVGNAVKFTDLGSVSVQVRETRTPSHQLLIDVVDTGIGMTREQVASLFEAFSQADTSTTRRFGGSGLGLKISKHFAQMMGGQIAVTSEPDCGSTFSLSLPLIVPDPVPAEPMARSQAEPSAGETGRQADPAQEPLAGQRIYFAEDGPDNQRLIGFLLRKAGADVTIFDNGRDLLQAMTVDGTAEGDLRTPPPCDLVLTDIQMPEMDGYSLATKLRQQGATLPIVALTAHAMDGAAKKCLEAGCDRYASKPIDRESLLAACNLHTFRRQTVTDPGDRRGVSS